MFPVKRVLFAVFAVALLVVWAGSRLAALSLGRGLPASAQAALDNSAAVVHLQMATGGAWYACSENAGLTSSATPPDTVWDCDTTSPRATVTSQDEINVVAHS